MKVLNEKRVPCISTEQYYAYESFGNEYLTLCGKTINKDDDWIHISSLVWWLEQSYDYCEECFNHPKVQFFLLRNIVL